MSDLNRFFIKSNIVYFFFIQYPDSKKNKGI